MSIIQPRRSEVTKYTHRVARCVVRRVGWSVRSTAPRTGIDRAASLDLFRPARSTVAQTPHPPRIDRRLSPKGTGSAQNSTRAPSDWRSRLGLASEIQVTSLEGGAVVSGPRQTARPGTKPGWRLERSPSAAPWTGYHRPARASRSKKKEPPQVGVAPFLTQRISIAGVLRDTSA